MLLGRTTDTTEPGLDIIFDTETDTHQYWHKLQLLAKGGTYVLLGLLARSLNDPWDKASNKLTQDTAIGQGWHLCPSGFSWPEPHRPLGQGK
jgi:D-arabinose 1-dehydrogenase-like Zn-dependent alcohol dehydrogenase